MKLDKPSLWSMAHVASLECVLSAIGGTLKEIKSAKLDFSKLQECAQCSFRNKYNKKKIYVLSITDIVLCLISKINTIIKTTYIL